jgi:hypothetical protein
MTNDRRTVDPTQKYYAFSTGSLGNIMTLRPCFYL